jgi:hypothetical protein
MEMQQVFGERIQRPSLVRFNETIEKPFPERLMENVQMQGLRNPEE